MAGEQPTGGRARPRARTHGEDEVTDALKNVNINAAPSPVNPAIVEPVSEQTPQKKESTAVGLLRRLSTRRHKEPAEREKTEKSHPPPSLAVYSPDNTPRKSFSVRRTRDRDSSATRRPDTSTSGKQDELLSPPPTRTASVKRTGGLGRSVSVNSSDIRRRLTRRGVSESTRPPLASENSHDSKDYNSSYHASSDVESRPSSGTATRTRSMGHGRQASVQVRRMRQDTSRTLDVPEETDAEMQYELDADDIAASNNSNNVKPVYLKGLFSVRTTSSRPIYIIRADIIRVLRQLGVEYKEIRGGFDCKHTPSIEQRAPPDEAAPSGAMPLTPPPETSHRRKISFGGFRRENSRDEFRSRNARAPSQDQHASNTASEDENENSEYEDGGRYTRDRTAGRSRAAGETSTHVQNDMGESMTLRFEIFVVKVPVFNLHGIQFKKVDGGTWQYKNMAQTILNELRL